MTFSQMVYAVSAKTASYSEFQSYTESKVKTFGMSSPGFCTITSPVCYRILTALILKMNKDRTNLPFSAILDLLVGHWSATNAAKDWLMTDK